MTSAYTRTTKLLVVDDDPSMARLLETVIKRQFEDEIELTTLTDPKEARRYIETQIVDILITDLEMPGVNGLELLRCAKHMNAHTQVLFMTGNSTFDALTDALELGATDYLLKPLDQALLIQLVRDAQSRLMRWREAARAGRARAGGSQRAASTK